MRIQHNIMALNSHRQLGINNANIAKSLEKLSSGYRINRAGDDAAGLAISEKMRAQIKGLEAATDNSQDAISLVQTAEGGLQEVHSMLNRMQELATKSSNGTYTNEVDRQALQDEVSALKDEINRIADSTNFNGIKLLDGSMGTGTSGAVASLTSSGTAGVVEAGVQISFAAPKDYELKVGSAANEKIEWNGNTLEVTLKNGKTYSQSDLDRLVNSVSGTPKEAAGQVKLTLNKGFKVGSDPTGDILAAAAKSADAKQAVATGTTNDVTVKSVTAGVNGSSLTIDDAGAIGVSVDAATGNVTMNLDANKSYTASEINSMLSDAGASMRVSYDGAKSAGELTNAAAAGGASVAYTLAGGTGLAAGGGLTLQIGDTNDSWNQLGLAIADMHVGNLGIGDIDISTREGASAAISQITAAINQVSTSRGKLGAIQNRLEHTINNLGVTTENITAAESRIRDVDMAKEMMEFTKNSVLMQSAQAMLAQANMQPQSVLQLLQ